MYLGQEKWSRGGNWSQPGAPQCHEIGDAANITVSGCHHGVVGPIVCGHYTLTNLNHGKPAYRKEQTPGRPDVMLYFWDERDGVGSSGWWLSPKIGSEVVWGFHPSRSSQTPPTTGWKVPYDGGVDPNFLISARRGPVQSAAPGKGQGPGKGMKGGQRPVNGQADQHRLQMEEARRQQDELNRKRIEDQRKRMEELKRQKEEDAKRRYEEQQKRVEEMKRQQEALAEERRAVAAIRQVLVKLRNVKPDELDGAEAELHCILEKELETCGSQKAAIREESDACVDQAKQRVAKIKEQQRQIQERRQEEERKRKEAQDLAEKLLGELEELVGSAEAAVESLKEIASDFTSNSDLTTMEDVSDAAKEVQEAEAGAKAKATACDEFIVTKRSDMAVSSQKSQAGVMAPKIGDSKEESAEGKRTIAAFQERIRACTRTIVTTAAAVKTERESKEKKIAAQDELEQRQAAFRKYDRDGDGALSRQEITQYAKGEHDFAITKESLDLIFEVLVSSGAKGVASEDCQRLRVMVGVAREKERNEQKRQERLKREQELADAQAELQAKIDDIASAIDRTAEALKKVEEQMKSPPSDVPSQVMLEHASAVDADTKQAKEALASTQEKIKYLGGLTVKPEHRPFIRDELRKLQKRVTPFEERMSKASGSLRKYRADAKRRATKEMELVQARALEVVREHQRLHNLQGEELFRKFDANGDDCIDESEFVQFFEKCEKRVEPKESTGEAQDAAAPEQEPPSAEDLRRLFNILVEDGQRSITRGVFQCFIRKYMKVIKDTVISDNLSVKGGKIVRRLELKEVVEILEGPQMDDSVGVSRVRAKAMSDGTEGWITVAGNQKSVYLEDGGGVFKVVKETILTDSFDLGAMKEVTRKLKETTRKLAPDELVEVREWPKLEESSGLTRMKCRVKSDGQIGWVTTVGNQGAVFLEVL